MRSLEEIVDDHTYAVITTFPKRYSLWMTWLRINLIKEYPLVKDRLLWGFSAKGTIAHETD